MYSLLQDSANEEGLFKAMNRVAYYIFEVGCENAKRKHHQMKMNGDETITQVVIEKPRELQPNENENTFPMEDDEMWNINLEDFIASIQREPELCQFFAEQYILDLRGSSVDPVLNSYTRTFMYDKAIL